MPYVNGTYRLPERTPSTVPDPLATAHARLSIYLWNVLAYRHDGDEHSAARWQKTAWEAAGHLRCMLVRLRPRVPSAMRPGRPRGASRRIWPGRRTGAPGGAWSRASAEAKPQPSL